MTATGKAIVAVGSKIQKNGKTKTIVDKPLTPLQAECLRAAEDTLYGDIKLVEGYGRSLRGLRNRGLIEGATEHAYLTDAGKSVLSAILAAP